MDIFSVVRSNGERCSEQINAFVADNKRLWSASRLVASAIIAIALLRAVGLAVLAQYIGHFLDASIGARGVGTVTSEMSQYAWSLMFLALGYYGSGVLLRRFSGLSLLVSMRVVNVVQPVALLAVAWPLLHNAMVLMLTLVILRAILRHPIVSATSSVLIAGVAFVMIDDLLLFAATRTITIGSMVTVGMCGIIFGLLLAVRPYRARLG